MITCWVIELAAMLHNPVMTSRFIMVSAVSIMVIKVYRGLAKKAKTLEKDINIFE